MTCNDKHVMKNKTDMDHPADVILHAWGMNWRETLERAVEGLANYMVPVHDIEDAKTVEMHVEGADSDNDLVFLVLDEYLFHFATELFVAKHVHLTQCDNNSATWTCTGERFVHGKHEQGTEVKAITMHNMRVFRCTDGTKSHLFVTLDI